MNDRSNDNFILKAAAEFVIYFCATLGISDMVLNTALLKKTGWAEDKNIPGTMMMCCIFPALVIAFGYIKGGVRFDLKTMIVYVVMASLGAYMGAGKMLSMDVEKLKKIIGFAMLISMAILIVRLILSRGEAGTQTGLHGWQFLIGIPFFYALGFFNNFGVPIKPPAMAFFLLIGVPPLTALGIMSMAFIGSWSAASRIYRSERYDKSMFKAAAIFGSIGAAIGVRFAVSINTYLLTAITLFFMAYIAYSMLKKQ